MSISTHDSKHAVSNEEDENVKTSDDFNVFHFS